MSDSEDNSLLVQSSDGTDDNSRQNISLKTKKLYEKSYTNFIEWKKRENLSTSSETVLLSYFHDMGTKYSPPTLYTEFSMLKTTLSIHEKVDVTSYRKLKAFLKQNAHGYKAKKSKIFSPGEINKFIEEAPDAIYLLLKTAVIFGVMGACRRQELHQLLYESVTDFNGMLLVNVMRTDTEVDRTFTVTGKYYHIVKKYMNLRPKACGNRRFFVKYYKEKCNSLNIGINAFGNMGKVVATYLQLENPELYTGHCFRRTSATVLINTGGDIVPIRSQGKSTSVAAAFCNSMAPAPTFSPVPVAPSMCYVALIFGVVGACRRQELYNLQYSDVRIFDKTILVTVRKTETKVDRTFTVTGSYCDLCKKYMNLRPKDCPTPNFFVNYLSGKCTKQNIGINKFGALGKRIAKYLNLPDPEMYTGHCFRRTSVTLKRYGGLGSTAAGDGYIDESMQNKVNMSNQVNEPESSLPLPSPSKSRISSPDEVSSEDSTGL